MSNEYNSQARSLSNFAIAAGIVLIFCSYTLPVGIVMIVFGAQDKNRHPISHHSGYTACSVLGIIGGVLNLFIAILLFSLPTIIKNIEKANRSRYSYNSYYQRNVYEDDKTFIAVTIVCGVIVLILAIVVITLSIIVLQKNFRMKREFANVYVNQYQQQYQYQNYAQQPRQSNYNQPVYGAENPTFCTSCGTRINPESSFCPICGIPRTK